MSELLDDIFEGNRRWIEDFEPGDRSARPRRRCAILTCMDARLEPLAALGLDPGDAVVVRNAGGRASDDAIRSLVVSCKLLGTREWLVVHHTRCVMTTIDDWTMGDLLQRSLEEATLDETGWRDSGSGPGTAEGRYVSWLTFSNPEQALVDDVLRIRNSPMVPPGVAVRGLILESETGRLREVEAASRAGRARE
ncbi:MAG: carbonic anhydrase [Wenzhouxiangellaceae bacterium]|nr:carbonic anhydrase [Wenzhouxiangellaceae bacterium]